MFAGGQVTGTPPADNQWISDAQFSMCGEPFGETRNNDCATRVESEYNAHKPAQNVDIYNNWFNFAWSYVYGLCGFNSAFASTTGGLTPKQQAAQCTMQAVNNQNIDLLSTPNMTVSKPIIFGGQLYTFSEFLDKAREMARAGVNIDDIPLDIPVPESVMNAIRELTGNNPLLNMEIVRVYREAMRTRPPMEQIDPAVQEKVGMNVVDYFKEKKTKGTEDAGDDLAQDAFYHLAVKSYGDVAFDDYSVVIKQIPDGLLTDLNITAARPEGEVRRLWVEVENTIKTDPDVAGHLATLDAAGRDTYMTPIRAQIRAKIKPAISEKIEGIDKTKQNDIAAELAKYYAVVDFTDSDHGRTVNIIKIELKEKEVEGAMIPEALINGLDGRSSIVRYAAIARLWGAVVELAPNAAEPGQLQDNLVNSIIGQRNGATTDELVRTIVLSVNEQQGTVALGYAPEGIRSPENPAWGASELDGSSVTIFEQYMQDNPGLNAADQTALAAEIREAVEAFEEEHAGEQTLDGEITRDENGSFHVTITRAGGFAGGDPTTNRGITVDGEVYAVYQGGSQGHAGEGGVSIQLGYLWPNKFYLYGDLGVLGYGAAEYLTNSDAASFQMAEGESNALRLDEAFLGGTILYDGGEVRIRAGHMGVRYGTDNPAFDYYHNMQFGLFPIPDIGTSRMLGGSVDWSGNFDNFQLTLGAKGGMGDRVSLWQSGGDQAGFTSAVVGGHAGVNLTLHEGTKTQLNIGAIGYYPGLVIVEGGLSTHFHENVILALDGRYSHIWTDGNPDTEDLYAVSLIGQFPFRLAGIRLIPHLLLSIGGRQGTADWGGEAVNGGCTHIGIDCGENLVDAGYRGFSGDLGLEFKPLRENSPVDLRLILDANGTYGTSLTSGADAGFGWALNVIGVLTF
jgi:hypothetical protein